MLGFYRNILLRSIFKHPFSTITEAAKLSETPQPELDKLYKTVEVELRGNDPAVLNSYVKFAKTTGNYLNVESQS